LKPITKRYKKNHRKHVATSLISEPKGQKKIKPRNNDEMMAAFQRYQNLQKSMMLKSNEFNRSKSELKPRTSIDHFEKSKQVSNQFNNSKKKKKRSTKKRGFIPDQSPISRKSKTLKSR
jgi:hypothetical protein